MVFGSRGRTRSGAAGVRVEDASWGGSGRRVYGVPGGGLANASWAANAQVAEVGAIGERKTAELLNRLANGSTKGPTVLHDVMIPSDRYTANIDHIVVVGNQVHLIDSKLWKPGFYWSLGGTTRRGMAKFPAADKQTMVVALRAIETHLERQGLRARVTTPVLVLWPSSKSKPMRIALLRVAGAKVMTATAFRAYSKKHFKGSAIADATADPGIVRALLPLLTSNQDQPQSRSQPRSQQGRAWGTRREHPAAHPAARRTQGAWAASPPPAQPVQPPVQPPVRPPVLPPAPPPRPGPGVWP